MTPEQRSKLQVLLPGMRTNARRKVSHNDFRKALQEVERLEEFLRTSLHVDHGQQRAEEWIAIAEKAAAGSDQPGTIRMTMEQLRSGMPPEHFLTRGN